MTDMTTEPIVKAQSPLSEAWSMFRRNHAAMAGLAVLIIIVLGAIFGPYLYPRPTVRDGLGPVLAARC